MSTIRRIGFCPRGYHQVATSHRLLQGIQALTLTCTTDLGNYVPWTYFRCADCGGLFTGEGSMLGVGYRKSLPVDLNLVPEHLLVELQKQPWWPKPDVATLTDWAALLDSDAGRARLVREFGFTLQMIDGRKHLCAPWYPGPQVDEAKREIHVEQQPSGGAHQGPSIPCSALPPRPRRITVDEARREMHVEQPLVPPYPPQVDPANMPNASIRRVMQALDKLKQVANHLDRRQLKDQVYCHIAETVAQLATCCRLKVGCVLLDEAGKVVGMGYNGAGPGMDHCHSDGCNEKCRCRRTRHAEKNALSNCSGKPYTAYLTAEPCCDCAKDIIAEGVRRVVYISPYNSMPDDERAARQEWIDHYQVKWEQLSEAK
jgi:dCMP deaminase